MDLLKEPEVATRINDELFELGAEGLFYDSYSLFAHGLRRVAVKVLGHKEGLHVPPWKADNQEQLAELSAHKRRVALFAPESTRTPQYRAACKYVKQETRKTLTVIAGGVPKRRPFRS